ncbi:aldose epimerase family protein [Heliomarina baculiformis]|uniref:aldose epimerase family protein n=1 Tax=Heliomarina baculiformis TaxID=2872036 RepID=UPI001EE2C1C6|nr:aldose epimerase family protein [Heliomarina baculiformis]
MRGERKVESHVLRDGRQSVTVLDLGCATQSWLVHHQGRDVPVVLGFDDPESYRDNPDFLGFIVGRMAGRIGGAAFEMDGARWALDVNEAPNHLHGGARGLHTRQWDMSVDGARAVELKLRSPHGEQGYPGQLDLTVVISLEDGWLCYDMMAEADRPTPVSLAQHSYYNLAGEGTIRDHRLIVPATEYLPVGPDLVTSGEVRSVAGMAFDCRAERRIAEIDPVGQGMDMTFAGLDAQADHPVRLRAPNGLMLEMISDQPCLQFYTSGKLIARHGADHCRERGMCLEPHGYPNAMNAGFPLSLAAPGQPYRQRTRIRIASET